MYYIKIGDLLSPGVYPFLEDGVFCSLIVCFLFKEFSSDKSSLEP